jgi:hypothetical protein
VRRVFIALMLMLIATVAVASLQPHQLYALHFDIDGQTYITDSHLTWADCSTVVKSTAHDPDSFRHGAGVYSCVKEK